MHVFKIKLKKQNNRRKKSQNIIHICRSIIKNNDQNDPHFG